MKPKRQSESLANRSGDRRIISASLTERNCPCPRRFYCARGHLQTRAANLERALGSPRVPAKSPFFSASSPPFPRKSQRVPPLSQPFPPDCRLLQEIPKPFYFNKLSRIQRIWERTRLACWFGRPAQTIVPHFPRPARAQKWVGRDFRRAAGNCTPAACAPPDFIAPAFQLVFKFI